MTSTESNIGSLWNSAVEKYREMTGVDLNSQNGTSPASAKSLDELNNFLDTKFDDFKKWRNDGGKMAKFRSVVKRIILPIDKMSGAVKGAGSSNAGSPLIDPSATIFGAMAFFISTAYDVSANFDLIIDFFIKLQSFMDTMGVLGDHLPRSPQYQRVVIEILTCLLKVCGISQKAMSKNRGVAYFEVLLKGSNRKLQETFAELESLIQHQNQLLQTESYKAIAETLNNTKAIAEVMAKFEGLLSEKQQAEGQTKGRQAPQSTNRQNLEEHIKANSQSLINSQLEQHRRRTIERLKGSGQWLLDDSVFQAWANCHSENPFLLITGSPGIGKSILSAAAVNYLREQNQQNPDVSIAYFYFNHNSNESRSYDKALYAVISQLCSSDPGFKSIVENILAEAQITVFSIWHKVFCQYFKAVEDRKLYLILDGIDESEQSDRFEFFKLCLPEIGIQDLNIRVLFLGRPEVESELLWVDAFDTISPIIRITSSRNRADIERYINFKYDRIPGMPKQPDMKTKLIKQIMENANGMFLWVSLVFEELRKRPQLKDKLKALDDLPKDLPAVYDRVFNRLEETLNDVQKMTLNVILCWAAYAEYPQSLQALRDATLSITGDPDFSVREEVNTLYPSLFNLIGSNGQIMEDNGGTEWDLSPTACQRPISQEEWNYVFGNEEDVMPSEDEFQHDFEQENLHSLSATFVHLRHGSLRDYLRDTKRIKYFSIIASPNASQLQLLLTCLEQLEAGSRNNPECHLMDDSLYIYAATFWIQHLTELDIPETVEADVVKLISHVAGFLTNDMALRKYMQYAHFAGFAIGVNMPLKNDYFIVPFEMTEVGKPPLISLAILNMLRKAVIGDKSAWPVSTLSWIESVLRDEKKLSHSLARAAISYWLDCDHGFEELFIPVSAIWRFLLAVRSLTSTGLVEFSLCKQILDCVNKEVLGYHLPRQACKDAVCAIIHLAEREFDIPRTPYLIFNAAIIYGVFDSDPYACSRYKEMIAESFSLAEKSQDVLGVVKAGLFNVISSIYDCGGSLLLEKERYREEKDPDALQSAEIFCKVFFSLVELQPTYVKFGAYLAVFELCNLLSLCGHRHKEDGAKLCAIYLRSWLKYDYAIIRGDKLCITSPVECRRRFWSLLYEYAEFETIWALLREGPKMRTEFFRWYIQWSYPYHGLPRSREIRDRDGGFLCRAEHLHNDALTTGRVRELVSYYREATIIQRHLGLSSVYLHLLASLYDAARGDIYAPTIALRLWYGAFFDYPILPIQIRDEGADNQKHDHFYVFALCGLTRGLYYFALTLNDESRREKIVRVLESLKQLQLPPPIRQAARKLHINVNTLLGKLYRNLGQRKAAKECMEADLKTSCTLLRNYETAMGPVALFTLARCLHAVNLVEDAKMAISLIFTPLEVFRTYHRQELSESLNFTFGCRNLQHDQCKFDERRAYWQSDWSRSLYICVSCVDRMIAYCEACYALHLSGEFLNAENQLSGGSFP